ncbi:MAG: TfuA-like protein, partial [bacterium]|nr:TfuA-like protein [bacterium]
MTVVVFLGPTMPVEDARAILPDATFLPPAQQGDVISAILRFEPTAVALIDGGFLHSLAVWHKEILWALDQNIAVLGASSMGALRAAECHDFGMVGVGRIYEHYLNGTLVADDEVAIVHADAAHGWRPTSEALVNVRATVASAVSANVLTPAVAESIIAAGKSLYFPDRTWASILSAVDTDALGAFPAFVREHAVDQKRLDAIELLTLIAAGAIGPPNRDDLDFNNSRPLRGLIARDRKVYRQAGPVSVE